MKLVNDARNSSPSAIASSITKSAVMTGGIAGPDLTNPAHPRSFLPADVFFAGVSDLAQRDRGLGTFAFIEIQKPYANSSCPNDQDASAAPAPELVQQIEQAIGQKGIFCWHDERFAVLLHLPARRAHQSLQRVAKAIATCTSDVNDAILHVTPAIGYVDIRLSKTLMGLRDKADDALARAKMSLEIEPSRHREKASGWRNPVAKVLQLWTLVPHGFAFFVQFILSLILGLGVPFALYAACDALGYDISGPVYIGVVVVLVITATMIWVEGILSLRATTPPEAKAPFPVATVIIPAYLPNEADTILETLKAFLRLDYPNTIQIIVAYNSPVELPVEDALRKIANEAAGQFLIEPVRVYGSSSKAQNVNAVIGRVKGEFVGIYDADHHPRPESLRRAWRWLSNGWDIVQGRCAIRNGTESWISRMVAIEFQQIYSVSHPGRARFHGFGIFGGSNGFWRTPVLHQTRMRRAMLTEDIDSSIRAVTAGYKIASDRDLVSDELAPTTVNQLLNQRLRWAQGWFQVSLRRILLALFSRQVTPRQKLGLIHLLIWRELFPWYSIQVVPIMTYWVWAYGWHYIRWAVPIFVATTIYTFSTGPAQILFAYLLAEKQLRRKRAWFFEYFIVSTLLFSPFKDALSRVAHLKELMRERAWRVTPRVVAPSGLDDRLAKGAIVLSLLMLFTIGKGIADPVKAPAANGTGQGYLAILLGGEVTTINEARSAAKDGRNAEAARLFEQAIRAVPARRSELLGEYADALLYSQRSAQAVPLYRELLTSSTPTDDERNEITSQLALALTWSGQYVEAFHTYDGLLARTPGSVDIIIHRARVLAWLNRQDDAVAALDAIAPNKWASGALGTLGDEILIEAARKDARTNENEASAELFARAIRHNTRLRPQLLREYADQLLFSDRATTAIPLYNEVIADGATSAQNRTEAQLELAQALQQSGQPKGAIKAYTAALAQASSDSDVYREAKRGQSLALTRAKSPAKALGAWTDYLKVAPNDVDALLHRAQLLSTLQQNDEALQTYKSAYAIDPSSVAARRGIVDETINLARIAAHDNKSTEAATLFATAMDLDRRKRKGVLREYADQLNFADKSSEAIPLYHEVLEYDTLSTLDRKRAMSGLADAYAWSGHADEAAAAYADVAKAFPADNDLQWTRLVFMARQGALTNMNAQSAALFAKAIALEPVRRASILREYADQLSFTGRATDAVALYQEVLSQATLTDADRFAAKKALAQAYDWSGRLGEARATYDELIGEHPDDISLQWSGLVVSAHEAEKADRNREAANLLSEANRLMPSRRLLVLKEFADQLTYLGGASKAIAFYNEVLTQPILSGADRVSAQKALAQAYDWSGDFDEAKSTYVALVVKNPNDAMLQWGLLVVSAHQAEKADRNKDAASYLAKALQLVPARRLLILKEYADKLTFSDRARDAIPLYRELIVAGGKAADIRSDELALALALAWDNQLPASLSEYQLLIAADTDDLEARNGAARILSWTGQQSDAETAYQEILIRAPNNADAQRGLAQVEDWQGHHQASETILAQRLHRAPNDLEAVRLLAQSQAGMGRPDEAINTIKLALEIHSTISGTVPSRDRTGTPANTATDFGILDKHFSSQGPPRPADGTFADQ